MRAMLFALSACACFVAGCATPIELPESFVELGDDGHGFRAMTSDDARVWVRTMDDPSAGDVTFWAETLKKDFVSQRGYEFVSEGEVENAAGEGGRWLEFTANHRGERVDYLVAIWARDRLLAGGKSLRIVEFAAEHEAYERRVEAVRKSLKTVCW